MFLEYFTFVDEKILFTTVLIVSINNVFNSKRLQIFNRHLNLFLVCWWRKLETKCIDDNFEMLVTYVKYYFWSRKVFEGVQITCIIENHDHVSKVDFGPQKLILVKKVYFGPKRREN